MLECDKCKYDKNPVGEEKCLYCAEKLNSITVLNQSKYHFDTISEAITYVEQHPLVKVGEVTATIQKHFVYTDMNDSNIMIRINPTKFSKRYFEGGWFSMQSAMPNNYRIINVSQTRADIILVFLKRNDYT